MSRQSRSPEIIEQFRERILSGALSILEEEGYHALTMRRLASRMDMTAANVYNYYGSKDEIYLALVVRGFQMLHDRMKNSRKGLSDPLARGRALIEAYLSFGMENGAYYNIMFTLPTPKYNDFKGTGLESVARVEMELSMEIMRMTVDAIIAMTPAGSSTGQETALRRAIEIWSMLHGMITLAGSSVVGYVIPDVNATYKAMIDDYMNSFPGPR